MAAIHNIVWLLVLIGVMILVHELGHFWAARVFNVRVDVFSFGFGPSGSLDSSAAIRITGFRRCSSAATSRWPESSRAKMNFDDPRAFLNKPRWQRLIIAVAGPR